MTAIENWAETAEQVNGTARPSEVQAPTSDATLAELAWHFYLPALNSGFEYYGMGILDMCLKGGMACNISTLYAA